MLSQGIRNPGLTLRISLAITLLSWASIAWGVLEMRATGEETLGSGLKIGLALLPAILGPFVALNFWWATRVIAALRRGENVLGRWHVSAAQLAAFITQDAERNRHGMVYLNDWTPPRVSPPGGIEIVFASNGVLVHETYFTLATSGLYTFERVGILPHSPVSIEFVTLSTRASGGTTFNVKRSRHVLRLPVTRPDCPEALKIRDHYRQVLAGTVIANPNFYRSRMRFGLIAAPICLLVAGTGLLLREDGAGADRFDLQTLMVAFGTVFALAALFLALLAWIIGRRQRQRP